jgi:hypothetical protein
MIKFIRTIRVCSVGLVLSTLVACSPGATVPSGSGAQTDAPAPIVSRSPEATPAVTASTRVAPSASQPSTPAVDRTPSVQSQEAPPRDQQTPEAAHVLPRELEGLWTSVGQGSAETIYRFRTDGRYDKVSILLQQRPSGIFSFTITASGNAAIVGDQLIFTPVVGTQSMEDPDSPSSNFNKPLADFTPDQFSWAFKEGQLILTNERGTVPYVWEPDQ